MCVLVRAAGVPEGPGAPRAAGDPRRLRPALRRRPHGRHQRDAPRRTQGHVVAAVGGVLDRGHVLTGLAHAHGGMSAELNCVVTSVEMRPLQCSECVEDLSSHDIRTRMHEVGEGMWCELL